MVYEDYGTRLRLTWNPAEHRFEAEFQDFQNDLDCVKLAGFKTTGPPEWTWYTSKIPVLEKLRKNKPPSGLTILLDALDQYKRLRKEEDDRLALLAELKKAKKAVVESNKPVATSEPLKEGQEFGYNYVKDVERTIYIGYVAPEWTGLRCYICNASVLVFELQNPPTCMWCEIQLDNSPDLF